MTDYCAETGSLSDADAILYGPNKYGFLQLLTGTKASLLGNAGQSSGRHTKCSPLQ